MKKTFTILGILLLVSLQAQYDNGPLSTGTEAEDGTAAPGGYEFSELQYDAGDDDTNSSAGFTGNSAANYMLSDDFRIPEGEEWNLESIELFAYATNLADGCPVQSANIFILDHLAGENIPVNTDDYDCAQTSLLRVFNSVDEPVIFNDQMMSRLIAKITFSAEGISLGEGYYSLRFQSTTMGGFNHFYPTVTVPGERSVVTENPAQQSNDNGVSWIDVEDIGYNGVIAPQDFPFVIHYSNLATNEIMSLDNRIKLYPNPAKDHFSVYLPDNFNHNNLSISVKDLTGKVVMNLNQFRDEFNVSSLPKGIYVVTVTDGKNTNTNKLIKQ